MRAGWRRGVRGTRRRSAVARWRQGILATAGLGLAVALLVLLVLLAGGGAADEWATVGPPAPSKAVREAAAGVQAAVSTVAPGGTPAAGAVRSSRAWGEATSPGRRTAPTMEELLAEGLALAGASPVHVAIRGTAGAESVRCAWRGIARTVAQRERAIRSWLRLGADEPLPAPDYLEVLFAVTLDTLDPEYRETAQANFRAIAQGGLSTEYLFLTCFADYAVSAFLLGSGTTPTMVTVAYDRRDEARSYDLYVREHDTGTFGEAALQTPGAYAAGLQAQVRAAEAALRDEIGGRAAVVFLAPLGAHHAIAYEAWQAVAQWAVVTDDAGVVQAVRDDTPVGDPEHTQTLANLTSRITTAASSDAHATTRVGTVGGLEGYYRTTLQAYGDITPGDGQTTPFTPQPPPPAPVCTNGTVFSDPATKRELVQDCETLLAAKDGLRGTATLNWSTSTALSSWTGVTTGGTPPRVTGLSLASKSMTGTIPPEVGHLFALTTLNLQSNQLTGDIPAELGWLDQLTELRLSGNTLTGCLPLSLRAVATNDLSALNLPYCEPPAPANLRAGTPGEASLVLLWDALTGASTYAVEVWAADGRRWRTASDTITGTTHTVAGLQCVTAYDVRVRASGNGTTYAAAWGAPSAVLTATTGACTPPTFVGAPYTFAVSELAAAETAVGTVTATDAENSAVTYAISEQSVAGAFAIDATSGVLTVAAAGRLDYETLPTHTLTVTATDTSGGAAPATVTITLTDATVDYDADDDGLIAVATLAQLNALRWDLDGDGASTEAGYAVAFPDAPTGMGCPATGCTGYELTAALDFDTDGSGTVDAGDAYWDGGAGWVPIGTEESPFAATFDGNGHPIAHLVINRGATSEVGLFGSTDVGSVIRHVGLVGVAVVGGDATGSLVGWQQGAVTGSFATGRVASAGSDIGGLVGDNAGAVTTSYTRVQVNGGDSAGGLVGTNTGTVTASYARGAVTGGKTGGLVGANFGTLTASYTSGYVTATTSTVGGLVGTNTGTATASYWDTATSGQTTSAAGTGQTTSALRTPSGYTGIYAAWNVDTDGVTGGDDPWDFGTASQYPVLKVDFDGNGTATGAEFGAQRANYPPVFAAGATATRPVAEHTAAGEPIGAPLTATDSDGDAVTHTLGGPDAASFALDAASGQLRTRAWLDYETRSSYTVTIGAADDQGASATITVTITVTDAAEDYDADDDGLVEVRTLAQLDAIRWDLDGDGAATAAGYAVAFPAAPVGMGCPASGCTGYELAVGLDFDTDGSGTVDAADAYWQAGAGWAPIGTWTAPFAATFDGNGHPIKHLFIDRGTTDYVGLFGKTAASSVVRHVGLPDVAVTGNTSVGGLVGWNEGRIVGSYVSGRVAGTGIAMGGLVGWNVDRITTSYATAAVAGGRDAGGLVGGSGNRSRITTSYARGAVTGADRVGGLAGFNAGRITASYARGAVTGTATPTGGLVAFNIRTATASYWDTATSGQSASAAGTGQTTSALQTPTSASGLYATWGTEWDFGTASEYPVLQVDFDGNGTATWQEFGDQRPAPPAPATLSATPAATSVALTWAAVSGAAKYRVEYRASDAASWTTASATLTTPTYTVADLTCTTAYAFRVSAYGNGTTYTAAWGAATTPVPATTTACAPGFGADAYTFPVAADAAVGTLVGTVTATGMGDATITYALTPSDGDAASFALDTTSGALTVAAPLTAAGTSYQLTVTARAGSGDAAPRASVPVTVSVQGAPPAPASLTATPAMTSVALTWATVPGASRYQVDYLVAGGESWTTASATVTALTHTIADLTCNTAYQFRVSAYGDAITHTAAWGAATAPVPATTTACAPGFGAAAYTFPVAADAAVGTVVGTVTATGRGDATISYALTPSDGDAASFALDTTSGTLTVAAALTAAGASYQLTVAARAGSGDAAPSASVPVTVSVQGAPPAPASLSATPAMTSVALTWATVPGASRYQVDYLVAGGESWTTASATVTALTHTIADLTCNTAYQFRVSAYGDAITHTAAWGAATAPVPATTTACAPGFGAAAYTFPVAADAAVGTVVGTVTATGRGDATISYALTPSDGDAASFALDTTSGTLTVAAALTAAGTSYQLTVAARAGSGDAAPSASVPVTVSVQGAPPAPASLSATPAMTSVALTWATVPGASRYQVDYLVAGGESWTTASATVTALTHTIADLTCNTAYQFRVSAYGDAITHTAAWGAATTPVPATTTTCVPVFDVTPYTFTVSESAGEGAVVGMVTATPTGGGTVTYEITAGNAAGTFAIDRETGQLTVTGTLDAASYALTISATEANGGTATVAVAIAVSTGTATATATATATPTPTPTATAMPPARPQNLRHVAGYDQVFLFWDDPDDSSITGYRILRRNPAVDPPGQFAILVENTGSAGNRYSDRSVAPETGYVYRIQARNAAGQLSERSGYTRADTAPVPTATPTATPLPATATPTPTATATPTPTPTATLTR